MSYVGIRDGAIKRAAIVDAELSWPKGLAIGKMTHIWENALPLEISVVRRKVILKWAGDLPEGTSEDQFIEALCSPEVRFLIPSDGDRYIIGGAEAELRKIEERKERSSRGGKSTQVRNRTSSGTQPGAASSSTQPKPSQAKPSVNQDTNNPPLSPPARGGENPRVSKRSLREEAEAVATAVTSLLIDNRDEREARERLSPSAWDLLLRVKPSWRKLQTEAGSAARQGNWEPFCARVRKEFVAINTRDPTGPPD